MFTCMWLHCRILYHYFCFVSHIKKTHFKNIVYRLHILKRCTTFKFNKLIHFVFVFLHLLLWGVPSNASEINMSVWRLDELFERGKRNTLAISKHNGIWNCSIIFQSFISLLAILRTHVLNFTRRGQRNLHHYVK